MIDQNIWNYNLKLQLKIKLKFFYNFLFFHKNKYTIIKQNIIYINIYSLILYYPQIFLL